VEVEVHKDMAVQRLAGGIIAERGDNRGVGRAKEFLASDEAGPGQFRTGLPRRENNH